MTDSDRSSALDGLRPQLREIIEALPRDPGVYLLKDRRGEIVYVGKAKSLHARVRSYFTRSGDDRAFVPRLGRVLGDVETIVTKNEKEALLLENTLIKQHRPRFNVKLRDDKNFLVLRLDPKANYPRLEVIRKIGDDGARYFGPYHSASSCRETLRIVNRYFQLRTCTDRTMASRSRACLEYQIGRCPAPCVLDVDREAYAEQVEDVTMFLRGKQTALIAQLTRRMKAAADELNFEHAARVRDQIRAVEKTLIRQQVISDDFADRDVFGYYREGDAIDVVLLKMREGQLRGREIFSLSDQEFPDDEVLAAVVFQYYENIEALPRQVLLPLTFEGQEALAQWLSERAGRVVTLLQPQRGPKRKILELARRNAQSHFETRRKKNADVTVALAKLQQRLRLTRLPRHIECFDISSLHGEQVVASMVVMRDGKLDNGSYKRFRIRKKGDDFAAIYEVIARRLRRGKDGSWPLADLMVVDGGKGQLGAALAARKDAELSQDAACPDFVGLAKERAQPNAKGENRPERVFLPNVKDPIRLRSNTAELFLLTQLRDEAHRFAITYHKKRRRARTFKSALDDIAGIGTKRKQQLLKNLGSLKRIRSASVEELARVPGMSQQAAEAVARYFATEVSDASTSVPGPSTVPNADD